MAEADSIVRIGPFQLENLRKNRVAFVFLDLSEPRSHDSDFNMNPLLAGSQSVPADRVLAHVRELNLPNHAAIVLICENGSKSLEAAHELENNGFINVVVIEGGVVGLMPGQNK